MWSPSFCLFIGMNNQKVKLDVIGQLFGKRNITSTVCLAICGRSWSRLRMCCYLWGCWHALRQNERKKIGLCGFNQVTVSVGCFEAIDADTVLRTVSIDRKCFRLTFDNFEQAIIRWLQKPFNCINTDVDMCAGLQPSINVVLIGLSAHISGFQTTYWSLKQPNIKL